LKCAFAIQAFCRLISSVAIAKSSFASILSRLNAGFASVINKFSKGKCSPSDIHALVNLSNSSRLEALKTFQQFSARMSQSSLGLPVGKPKRKSQSSSKGEKELRGSSPVSSSGKSRHKTVSASPRRDKRLAKVKSQNPKSAKSSLQQPKAQANSHLELPNDDHVDVMALSIQQARRLNRTSMISFLSESTKIGEILERNTAMGGPADRDHLADTAFPLSPWKKPPKSRSRFMRLFRKAD
jgi:hypothetical protein